MFAGRVWLRTTLKGKRVHTGVWLGAQVHHSKHKPNVRAMLGQRHERMSSVESILDPCLVISGKDALETCVRKGVKSRNTPLPVKINANIRTRANPWWAVLFSVMENIYLKGHSVSEWSLAVRHYHITDSHGYWTCPRHENSDPTLAEWWVDVSGVCWDVLAELGCC